MQLKNAKFITSMSHYEESEIEPIPQIAVVGKSNVGKSSFINCLTNNHKLSKVGKTPGKTRLINWFLINQAFYLVDLPGYGYAKRSKEELANWGKMIENYLMTSEQLAGIILLLDIRHSPTVEDRQMLEWMQHYGIEPLLVCTKADKIAKSKRKNQCVKIANELGFGGRILPIDSMSGYGRDEILNEALLNRMEESQ